MNPLDALLPAIRAGDAEAFGRWVAGVERPLRAALRPFAAVVDTEAVLQESFLRVWQVAPRFESDGRPEGLLRLAQRIARNLAISECRRRHADPTEDEALERAASDPSISAALPDPLLREAIADCHRKLPEKPALAISARLESGGGEPDQVLAERLAMRLNTFLQNVTRARKLLADCLRARGIEP